MHRIIYATLVAVFAAVGLVGIQSPAEAVKTSPICQTTGGRFARHVSVCIQASYKEPAAGRCPKWRKFLVGIGVGGQHLEEGNGAVLHVTSVRRPNRDFVGRWTWDNLFETTEDHYRQFYNPANFRSRYVAMRTSGELLIDNGRNRTFDFSGQLWPWPGDRC